MKKILLALVCFLPLAVTGCIVIPIGDLLRGPSFQEQVLVEGEGWFSKDKIVLVDIDGVIQGKESPSLLFPAENTASETKAQLDFARSDPEVKAVVIRISSPGGEVSACDVIRNEVKKLKAETRLPVVACITDQGASGAYYVAVACDTVFAQPTAIVGSIGVILQHFDISGLMQKIGVASAPVKSSPKKDLNSLFRPMTDEERQILEKLVGDMYQRFIDVVAEGRPQLTKDEVRGLADGRVVSGVEAATLKLVDRVGYMADAIEEARRAAGIESPTIIRYTRVPKSGANVYTQTGPNQPAAREASLNLTVGLDSTPRLYYLWRPGF